MPNSYFIWNGRSSEEFGIRIEKYPNMNRPARKFTSTNVPGRNGNVYQFQDAYAEVVQKYEIFAGEYNADVAVDTFYPIVEWLNSADGYAVLEDSYDSDHYREAVYVDAANITNNLARFGRTTISFRCKPERFLKTDPYESNMQTNQVTLVNPTKNESSPIIEIETIGFPTILNRRNPDISKAIYAFNKSSDDYELTVLPIDKAYWYDNMLIVPDQNKIYNSLQAKDIDTSDTVILAEGTTVIDGITVEVYDVSHRVQKTTFSGSDAFPCGGLLVKADPMASYVLKAWECYRTNGNTGAKSNSDQYIIPVLLDANGRVLKVIARVIPHDDYLRFDTTAETNFIVLCFCNPNTGSLTGNVHYGQLQFHKGEELTPFIPYNENRAEMIINGISLYVGEMPDRLTVDCESEDCYRGKENYNSSASFADLDGYPTECFKLKPGENAIEWDGDHITRVTIYPRYWEL